MSKKDIRTAGGFHQAVMDVLGEWLDGYFSRTPDGNLVRISLGEPDQHGIVTASVFNSDSSVRQLKFSVMVTEMPSGSGSPGGGG